ncbi:L-methionine gamma-lyase-like isoform X1 [Patiria miniata]|uniref:cystathionine gamma-lyase n=1 Tax=Patiria miniata TaxID=46514 RepID=A0A914AXL5_PATMI|nr:L-methionine gamma-lyase-like isoform X1 [Patiria miniata]XP_038068881.1 L-methionine gamma-lyase-like isoform X1 [Patiria miniata]
MEDAPKPRRVPSSFQDSGGIKDPKTELRRDEEMHRFDSETSLETKAVCSQSKLKGLELTTPLVPSISVASTFSINKVDEYMECLRDGYIYSRLANHSCDSAAHAINSLEGGVGTLVFSSGMGAIATTLLALLKTGDHVIAPDSAYSGTYAMMKSVLPNYGIEVTFVKACDIEEYKKAIKPNTKIFYGETPCNPCLAVLDLKAFADVAKTVPLAISVVDSTFGSPCVQRPLEFGVDISINSCTKYIGGHSDIVAGSMSTRDEEILFGVGEFLRQTGNCLSPFDAFLLLRGVRTLPLRMEKHSQNGLKIAQYLEQHSKISKVYYPGLPSHPQHEVAKKQMSAFGGMVVFEVADGLQAAKTLVESVKLITLAVSLGSTESLIEHPATMTHGPYLMTSEDRQKGSISDGLIRFSVGIENVDDLIRDLEQALAKV